MIYWLRACSVIIKMCTIHSPREPGWVLIQSTWGVLVSALDSRSNKYEAARGVLPPPPPLFDGMLVHCGSPRKLQICRYLFGTHFIHLGGERHCMSKVYCPRTQHNVAGQGLNPTTIQYFINKVSKSGFKRAHNIFFLFLIRSYFTYMNCGMVGNRRTPLKPASSWQEWRISRRIWALLVGSTLRTPWCHVIMHYFWTFFSSCQAAGKIKERCTCLPSKVRSSKVH